jgi:DNA-binding MarR family transcriptional regulator
MKISNVSQRELDVWRGFRRMGEIISARIGQKITRATGLSTADFSILMILDQDESLRRRQRDLQAFLEWDKTRLSHQLTRMVARGLVEKKSLGRSGVEIDMTEEGKRLLDAAKPVHRAGLRKYFLDHIDEADIAALATVAQKLRAALLDPRSWQKPLDLPSD